MILVARGVSVSGDSAQFSAMITALADQRFVATALSVQLGWDLRLRVVAIWLVPSDGCFLGFLAVDISHVGSRPVDRRFCHAVVEEKFRQCAVGQGDKLEIAIWATNRLLARMLPPITATVERHPLFAKYADGAQYLITRIPT